MTSQRISPAVSLALLALALTPVTAAAQCDEQSFVARVASADAVFIGRVLGFEIGTINGRVVPVFSANVERSWKGSPADTVTLAGSIDAGSPAALAGLAKGQTLVVFATRTKEGYYRISECLGSGELQDEDARVAMLDYVTGAHTTIVAAEGGGLFSDGEPGPSFGVSLDRAIVEHLHLRLRLSQGPYSIEPAFTPDREGATGHAIALGIALRARAYAPWPGVLPYATAGIARLFPVDGLASFDDLDAGLVMFTTGVGVAVPVAAQFGAFIESEVAISFDGGAPRAYAVRAGVQVAL
jgi:hypothetical protein